MSTTETAQTNATAIGYCINPPYILTVKHNSATSQLPIPMPVNHLLFYTGKIKQIMTGHIKG
jgi:hypothetical protein